MSGIGIEANSSNTKFVLVPNLPPLVWYALSTKKLWIWLIIIPRMESAVDVVSSVTKKSAVFGVIRSSSVNVLWESIAASFGFWLNIIKKLEAVIRILLNVFSADERHCLNALFTVLSGIIERRCSSMIDADPRTLKSDQFRTLICSILGNASNIIEPVPFIQSAAVSGQKGSFARCLCGSASALIISDNKLNPLSLSPLR